MVSVKIICFFINKVIRLEPNCNKDFLLCFICTLVWILFYRHTSNNIHKELLTAAFYRSVVQMVEEKKNHRAPQPFLTGLILKCLKKQAGWE